MLFILLFCVVLAFPAQLRASDAKGLFFVPDSTMGLPGTPGTPGTPGLPGTPGTTGTPATTGINADSIMVRVRESALRVGGEIPDFSASFHISGDMDVVKRGRFMKAIPFFHLLDDGADSYFSEFIGGLTFTNPDIYNQTLYSISSKKSRFFEEHMKLIVAPSIKLNPYSQYLYGYIYSPLAHKGGKYYDFSVDSCWVSGAALSGGGEVYYRISFVPRIGSYKFVEGSMVVASRNWTLREMSFSGGMEFVDFSIGLQMGNEFSPDEFLPQRISILADADVMGTVLKGRYVSSIYYDKISPKRITSGTAEQKEDLDLSELFPTQEGTISSIAQRINDYRDSVRVKDNVSQQHASAQIWKFMLRNHTVNLQNEGQLKFSPLVSPILFHFSTSQGLSYTQRFKYLKRQHDGRGIMLQPRLGYNFKFRELYWGVEGGYTHSPRRLGEMFFDVGNGNKVFARQDAGISGNIAVTDNGFRFTYAKVGNKVEISNGFTVSADAALLQYVEIHNSTNRYVTFVPEVEFQYTPHQYYYLDGNRKVYLYSRYPTFTLNFAHAIKGVFSSTTKYNKVEFDMQQKLYVGPMHTLHYRVGFGVFFDYKHLYFAQFNNLKRNILPEGWDDDIGGSFHLLNSVRYNEFDKYLRANVKYDAPLLLLPTLLKRVKYITRERLYCNLLFVDVMDPYIELGYGLGTSIFNVGIFWGGEISKCDKIGLKFTFEIFN